MGKNWTEERYAEALAKAPKRPTFASVMNPAITGTATVRFEPKPGAPRRTADDCMVPAVPKRSKHGAVKTTVDGETFDSKHEATHWMALQLREKAGEIRNLRRQVRFSLFAPGGEHLGTWRADFVWEELQTVCSMQDSAVRWNRIVADAKSAHTRKLDKWERTKTLMMACHGVTVREML